MFGLRNRVRDLESRIQWLERTRMEDSARIWVLESALNRLANVIGYRAVHVSEHRQNARIDFEKVQTDHRNG